MVDIATKQTVFHPKVSLFASQRKKKKTKKANVIYAPALRLKARTCESTHMHACIREFSDRAYLKIGSTASPYQERITRERDCLLVANVGDATCKHRKETFTKSRRCRASAASFFGVEPRPNISPLVAIRLVIAR